MMKMNLHSPSNWHADQFAPTVARWGHALGELPANVLKYAYAWQRRRDQRQQLMNLSDHQLRDIGINREAARDEYNKPFWLP